MQNKEIKKPLTKEEQAKEKEQAYQRSIHLGHAAYFPDAIKPFFVAVLTSMQKYLEMNQAIYGENNEMYIDECEKNIAIVKSVVNGETFSRGPFRDWFWGENKKKWWDGCLKVIESLAPHTLAGEDKYYTARKTELGAQNEAVSKKFD